MRVEEAEFTDCHNIPFLQVGISNPISLVGNGFEGHEDIVLLARNMHWILGNGIYFTYENDGH